MNSIGFPRISKLITCAPLLQTNSQWMQGSGLQTYLVPLAVRHMLKKQKRRRYKHKGIRTPDSTYVTSGTVLARQRGLVYFPGENVGIGRDFTLFALEHGRVFLTTEKFEPHWEHSFIKRFLSEHKDDPSVEYHKTFMHVIPAPMPQVFKLKHQL